MVGLTNARSIQDEKIVESIFSSHKAPDSRVSQPVFGATSTNLIIDARPTTNAVANTAKGAGTENMDHYKECKKAYLGIDNIHTMRDSLNKVIEALGESEALAASVSGDLPGTNVAVVPVDRQALRRSGWLRHQVAILEGTLIIVRNVHVNHSHVLIHCSDGWDRTSQLSAVSQLCLDPYYRTTRGFQVLIEKDFVSFGHRFLDRCGHLSSEKFFLAPVDGGGGADVAQALFASVQNRFAGNHHIKETSPVFHQFLEAVHNIQRQFPARFEFNELLLRDLHTHLYSCQFGTFLFNSERDRREGVANTVSVWDYINSEPQAEKYINPEYNPALDDPASRAPNADQGVLFPNPKDVRFWHELYGRSDEEMNGRFAAVPAPLPAFTSGVIESLEDDLALPDASISLSSSGPPSRAASTPPPALSSSPAPVLSPVPARVPSPLALGPRVARPPPTDLFVSASGGVRSMWDRLSSGAGAAFSAVQDAYGTTATTTRDTRSRSSSALVASGELQDWGAGAGASPSTFSRFDPPRVAQAVRPSTFSGSSGPAGSASGSGSANPWAVATGSPVSPRGPDGIPSVLVDNPWNSTRRAAASRSQPDPFGVDELAATLPRADRPHVGSSNTSLPADPSVALPSPTPHLHSANPGDALVVSSTGSSSEAPKLPEIETGEEMDPLGVGIW
jgi:myotubularin-related protein 6/7/8